MTAEGGTKVPITTRATGISRDGAQRGLSRERLSASRAA